MRSKAAVVAVFPLALLFCVACASRVPHDLSWSIDRSGSAEGGRSSALASALFTDSLSRLPLPVHFSA